MLEFLEIHNHRFSAIARYAFVSIPIISQSHRHPRLLIVLPASPTLSSYCILTPHFHLKLLSFGLNYLQSSKRFFKIFSKSLTESILLCSSSSLQLTVIRIKISNSRINNHISDCIWKFESIWRRWSMQKMERDERTEEAMVQVRKRLQ